MEENNPKMGPSAIVIRFFSREACMHEIIGGIIIRVQSSEILNKVLIRGYREDFKQAGRFTYI